MKTSNIRILLLISLSFLIMIIYTSWNIKFNPIENKSQNKTQVVKENNNIPTNFIDKNPNIEKITNNSNENIQDNLNIKPIKVITNVYKLEISPNGGSIINLELLKYPIDLKEKKPLPLMSQDTNNFYQIDTGVTSNSFKNQSLNFVSDKESYEITDKKTSIILKAIKENGIIIEKTYTFLPNSYDIQVTQKVINNTDLRQDFKFYGQIIRKDNSKEMSFFDPQSYATYNGVILSTETDTYQKVSYDDLLEKSVQILSNTGWAVMAQHYFISAFVPGKNIYDEPNRFYAQNIGNNKFRTGAITPNISVPEQTSYIYKSQIYVGPTLKNNLDKVAPNLALTVDYGWLWFISDFLLWVMEILYSFIANWGLAIILVTFLIKLAFYPLSAKSYRSMAKMRILQPKVQQLKERLGDDRQKMSQAMMDLYRREKVNPLGGCLPMIVQIPVFIALYWVLLESVQFRQAPFFLWIDNLSVKDPYYILPILMGISMFIQQKLNPTPPDPIQAKMMMFLPVIFTVLFLNFPSGLVLYWFTNNMLGILQQWYVNKTIDNENKNITQDRNKKPANSKK